MRPGRLWCTGACEVGVRWGRPTSTGPAIPLPTLVAIRSLSSSSDANNVGIEIGAAPDLRGLLHAAIGARIELEDERLAAIRILVPEVEVPGTNRIAFGRGEQRSALALDEDWAISTARCISPNMGIVRQLAGESSPHSGKIDFHFQVFARQVEKTFIGLPYFSQVHPLRPRDRAGGVADAAVMIDITGEAAKLTEGQVAAMKFAEGLAHPVGEDDVMPIARELHMKVVSVESSRRPVHLAAEVIGFRHHR